MIVRELPPPFIGRVAEVAALRAELATVRSGRPRVVLVEGEAGIGKSAMLDHFLSGESDLTVLRAAGEEWEAFVGYGVVDQLLQTTGVSGSRLLANRLRSLPAEEPLVVGSRILELLEELEQKAAVAIVVDDAHWADVDSLRALLFAVRRLVGERVLTLLAQRSEAAPRLPDGLRRMAGLRTGTTIRVTPLSHLDVQSLATALGVPRLSGRAARQLHEHVAGNPLHITTLLAEIPRERWQSWDPVLPAPRAFAARVIGRLEACSPQARRLVEAAAVLAVPTPLIAVATLAEVPDQLDALDEAAELNLLQLREDGGIRDTAFTHPLVQAAVYAQLGPARRVRLHSAAAEIVGDEASALRHRVMAASPPDPGLVADLDAFATRRAAAGAWAGAAWALVAASRLSLDSHDREQWLLRAVDAMIGAGELREAEFFARAAVTFAPGSLRNAALGYLAVLRGQPVEAERLLRSAWDRADDRDPTLRAVIAQRLALHGVGQLSGADVVEWARRAVRLAAPHEPVRMEAEALIGLGLGWQGRVPEGLAAYESILAGVTDDVPDAQLDRVRFVQGWLRLAADDLQGARTVLARTAPAALHAGSIRVAVWSYAWLAHTRFALGAWDEAAADAERAVSLLEESGHEWLRPLVRSAAVLVPAARGSWTAAEEHAREAATGPGAYPLMVVAAGLAQAQVPAARGDHEGVLRALEPLVRLAAHRRGDEPGFWPWPDLYAEALVGTGRLDDADAFLAAQEERAATRGQRSSAAALARARGRLEAARGRMPAAEEALRRGLSQLEPLPLPLHRAQLELAYGQALRRAGRRRDAADQLRLARHRLVALCADPYLERCERELAACGLKPAKRRTFDRSRLTAQELAVARQVAAGKSNRQVASILFISIKTVQFHLSHIYAKLGLGSRAELAAHFREYEQTQDPAGSGQHQPDE